jgi:hypothetical protein
MMAWVNDDYAFDRQMASSQLAGINIPHLPYRFSFSSTTTPATANSRQYSFHRDNNPIIGSGGAIPRLGTNTRRHSLILENLRQKYNLGETAATTSSMPSTPSKVRKSADPSLIAQHSAAASPGSVPPPLPVAIPAIDHQQPSKITERHEISRFAMRMLLNILYYFLVKQSNEFPSSSGDFGVEISMCFLFTNNQI